MKNIIEQTWGVKMTNINVGDLTYVYSHAIDGINPRYMGIVVSIDRYRVIIDWFCYRNGFSFVENVSLGEAEYFVGNFKKVSEKHG